MSCTSLIRKVQNNEPVPPAQRALDLCPVRAWAARGLKRSSTLQAISG